MLGNTVKGVSTRSSMGGPGEFFTQSWSERPVSDLFLFGLGRAACISENRSGTVNPRDDDGSLVPPGDTGLSRSGGPARASPTQSRTAAPPSGRSHPPNRRPSEKKFPRPALGSVPAIRLQRVEQLHCLLRRSAHRGDHSDICSQIRIHRCELADSSREAPGVQSPA
jgi:hypothetical protein